VRARVLGIGLGGGIERRQRAGDIALAEQLLTFLQ